MSFPSKMDLVQPLQQMAAVQGMYLNREGPNVLPTGESIWVGQSALEEVGPQPRFWWQGRRTKARRRKEFKEKREEKLRFVGRSPWSSPASSTTHKYWPTSNGAKFVAHEHVAFLPLFFKMLGEEKCNFCGGPSGMKCGSCRGVSYCCKDHQKLDWKNHKPQCPCFKVERNETFGRHLVATRNIPEGEVIIQEAPLVMGPAQVTPPVCLGCHELLSPLSVRDCSTCGWPVCSETCERSPAHRPECEITSQHKNGKVKINTFEKNLPHPSYQCLTVLRCMYLRKARPELWAKLMELESHCRERKSTPKYGVDQKFISEFIPKFFNFFDFSSEEIMKVAGIVQVNAHEVPLTEPEYVAIYERASLLEHNCSANCMKSFTNSGELVIRAAQKISPGDHLSICYTDPLWGREMRMTHLLETKFFRCRCRRCLDPTEFGTHFNSFKCLRRECRGYITPLDGSALPPCPKCGEQSDSNASAGLETVSLELSKLDKKSSESCKSFLEKYRNLLHPNHHLLVSVKLALLDLFGWPASLLSLPDSDLEWTLKTCEEVYQLATKLVPAENRLRGLLLYHLQFAMMECHRRTAMKTPPEQALMIQNLLERRKVVTEAYKLLRYEPDELPEGKMAMGAQKTLEDIDHILKTQYNEIMLK